MKIEMNTKEATKEELLHLSNMLLALAGEPAREQSPSTVSPSEISSGFISMFGDDMPSNPSDSSSSSQTSSSVYDASPDPAPVQSGDVFSIFSDSPREEPKKDSNNSIRVIEY